MAAEEWIVGAKADIEEAFEKTAEERLKSKYLEGMKAITSVLTAIHEAMRNKVEYLVEELTKNYREEAEQLVKGREGVGTDLLHKRMEFKETLGFEHLLECIGNLGKVSKTEGVDVEEPMGYLYELYELDPAFDIVIVDTPRENGADVLTCPPIQLHVTLTCPSSHAQLQPNRGEAEKKKPPKRAPNLANKPSTSTIRPKKPREHKKPARPRGRPRKIPQELPPSETNSLDAGVKKSRHEVRSVNVTSTDHSKPRSAIGKKRGRPRKRLPINKKKVGEEESTSASLNNFGDTRRVPRTVVID